MFANKLLKGVVPILVCSVVVHGKENTYFPREVYDKYKSEKLNGPNCIKVEYDDGKEKITIWQKTSTSDDSATDNDKTDLKKGSSNTYKAEKPNNPWYFNAKYCQSNETIMTWEGEITDVTPGQKVITAGAILSGISEAMRQVLEAKGIDNTSILMRQKLEAEALDNTNILMKQKLETEAIATTCIIEPTRKISISEADNISILAGRFKESEYDGSRAKNIKTPLSVMIKVDPITEAVTISQERCNTDESSEKKSELTETTFEGLKKAVGLTIEHGFPIESIQEFRILDLKENCENTIQLPEGYDLPKLRQDMNYLEQIKAKSE
jgi:hypothetical protein